MDLPNRITYCRSVRLSRDDKFREGRGPYGLDIIALGQSQTGTVAAQLKTTQARDCFLNVMSLILVRLPVHKSPAAVCLESTGLPSLVTFRVGDTFLAQVWYPVFLNQLDIKDCQFMELMRPKHVMQACPVRLVLCHHDAEVV